MNRCRFGGLSEERPSVFKTRSSLVLIYRPNVAGMKGRVDLAQPVNRTPDLCTLSGFHGFSSGTSWVYQVSTENDLCQLTGTLPPLGSVVGGACQDLWIIKPYSHQGGRRRVNQRLHLGRDDASDWIDAGAPHADCLGVNGF
ncbi:hypothetical protein TNCV_5074061 [Trichonephila clavipes]|nr:hypothetical protein TNCV_5074061 [Trichonephila clavipes]